MTDSWVRPYNCSRPPTNPLLNYVGIEFSRFLEYFGYSERWTAPLDGVRVFLDLDKTPSLFAEQFTGLFVNKGGIIHIKLNVKLNRMVGSIT